MRPFFIIFRQWRFERGAFKKLGIQADIEKFTDC